MKLSLLSGVLGVASGYLTIAVGLDSYFPGILGGFFFCVGHGLSIHLAKRFMPNGGVPEKYLEKYLIWIMLAYYASEASLLAFGQVLREIRGSILGGNKLESLPASYLCINYFFATIVGSTLCARALRHLSKISVVRIFFLLVAAETILILFHFCLIDESAVQWSDRILVPQMFVVLSHSLFGLILGYGLNQSWMSPRTE